MKFGIYAVYDRKAASFARPFTIQNDAMANRAFAAAKQDPTSELSKYPEDYALYNIGTFEDDSGTIFANLPTVITEV